MKRIEQKVKDLVELRTYTTASDYANEPVKAVSSYHFTDVTSDLMAKWLGRAARVTNGSGAAFALAGFRGVGKSHFLAVLGAVLKNADLRARLSDSHVDATAHSLGRRKFNVVWVRRGTAATLIRELKAGIAELSGGDADSFSDSLADLVNVAQQASTDGPLVFLVDTAYGRGEPVTRDDGPVLGELAEIAKVAGHFIGIALDDDISGADGANSAITRSYSIDYLDQEHLYRIVDSHIFPKNSHSPDVLKEIYEYYNEVIPGFRWSERRFGSLYPLHPGIMEIAPFVRLYLPEFALLGFASEAGARILGRPANSLIAPDEVYDNVEASLRAIPALSGAFETYDRLNQAVVAKTPVVKRLQAKLILKGLLLFSLNDEGSSASEIGASMLIFDESEPNRAIQEIDSVLAAFAAAAQDGIRVTKDASGALRYCFRLNAKDDLKVALAGAITGVDPQNIEHLVKRLFSERFPDCNFVRVGDGDRAAAAECFLLWRGGVRKGRLDWKLFDNTPTSDAEADWSVVVTRDTDSITAASGSNVGWIPSEFTGDENELLSRFWLLQNDPTIRADFTEHLAPAMQTHAAAAAKIFQRAFIDDAALSICGFEYNFTNEARSLSTLTQLFSEMLEPLFETRFPQHPVFTSLLGMKEVARLANDFFSGANTNVDEVQRLARICCQPLGLVEFSGSTLVPSGAEQLLASPFASQIAAAVDTAGEGVVSVETIRRQLQQAPYGLVPDAVYLTLTAMVAARIVEFVTTTGDRINHRSLDLKLIWGDIEAVARPLDNGYSNERLVFWASHLAQLSPELSLNDPNDVASIRSGLEEWLSNWQVGDITSQFAKVDDCHLNSSIWKAAAVSIKTFEYLAETITLLTAGTIQLDECLIRIAETFSDSESEFAVRAGNLANVKDFLAGIGLRNRVVSYLAMCEVTGDPEIDQTRLELWEAANEPACNSVVGVHRDLENLWIRFQKAYSDHYFELHQRSQGAVEIREKLAEIKKTDVWSEFERLSAVRSFDNSISSAVNSRIDTMSWIGVRCPVQTDLAAVPACGCGFSISALDEIGSYPTELWQMINGGIFSHRKHLQSRRSELTSLRSNSFGPADVKGLIALLDNENDRRRLTEIEIDMITELPSADSRETSSVNFRPNASLPSVSEFDDLVESLS